jgi:anti-sigma factor RsiW
MSTTTCPPVERWRQHLDGSLPQAEQDRLNAHLGDCPACQQAVEALTANSEFRELAPHAARLAPLPAAVLQRAQAALRERADDGWPVTTGDERATVDDDLPRELFRPSEQPGGLGRLGHFEILDVLGRGGMGVVFRARDEQLHRTVAVKVLSRQLAGSALARQRFLREARAAAAVTHEHVVAIHAVEEAEGFPYLVMQYVAGRSLAERLRGDGPLPVPDVLRIGQQIALGLAAAHAQGLVHRDVKPANVLLENGTDRVKLTDFGLARAAEGEGERLTQSGCVPGTPAYMSPEQADGRTVDARSDLFSLGTVLYELCTGQLPFRGKSYPAVLRSVACDEPRPVREWNPEVPVALAAVIGRLHAKDAGARYQTADEVAAVLGGLLTDGRQTERLIPPIRPPGRQLVRGRRAVMLGLAGVTIALAASLLIGFVLWRPRNPGGEAAPARLLQPAYLERMKPGILQDWGTPAHPDLSGVDTKLMMKVFPDPGEKVLVHQFDVLPSLENFRRTHQGFDALPTFNNLACCLTGRFRGGERTSLSVVLYSFRAGALAIHACSDGILDITPAKEDGEMRLQRVLGIWREFAHPNGEPTDLLLTLQDRRLRVFVNDQECPFDYPIMLPEEAFPVDPRWKVYCWGPKEARVEILRWRVWDLDHPKKLGEEPIENEPRPQR